MHVDGSQDGTKDNIINVMADTGERGWLQHSEYVGEIKENGDHLCKVMSEQSSRLLRETGMILS